MRTFSPSRFPGNFFAHIIESKFCNILKRESPLDMQKNIISPVAPVKLPYKGSSKWYARDSETTVVQSYMSSKLSHNDRSLKNRLQNEAQKSTLSACKSTSKCRNHLKTAGIVRRDIYLDFRKDRSKKSIF